MRFRPHRFCIRLSGAVATALSSPLSALAGVMCVESGFPDYEVVHLEGLGGPTFGASAMNDSGEVAGSLGTLTAFVWTEDGIRTTEFKEGPVSVHCINEDGVVVGTITSGIGVSDVFLWFSRTGEVQRIGTPVTVYPAALNNDLIICGADIENLFGFALETMTGDFHPITFGDIPNVGVGTLGANAVSDSGIVVGGEVVFQRDFGFYMEVPYKWTDRKGIAPLATLPGGFGGRAIDINENGDMAGIVINDFSGNQPALWTEGGAMLTPIPVPFGFFVADATGLNDRNQVTVIAPNDLFGYTRAFLWEDGVYTDLSCFAPPNLFAIRPLDINNHGEILTQLSNAIGQQILDVVILRPKGLASPGDLDGDGDVDFNDLLMLLAAWGDCARGDSCPADLDDSGGVGFGDLLILLANWS